LDASINECYAAEPAPLDSTPGQPSVFQPEDEYPVTEVEFLPEDDVFQPEDEYNPATTPPVDTPGGPCPPGQSIQVTVTPDGEMLETCGENKGFNLFG